MTADGPSVATAPRPGWIGRLRSRQAGHPSGLVGRIVGRLMVAETGRHNDRSIELLGADEASTVLEVGFGQGRTVARLVGRGHRVIGVDVSDTMLRQATARNRRACGDGRAVLRSGDGLNIPFDTDGADAALTTHTIYFMADPASTIADVARVLRPGGRLVLVCHVGDDPMPAWMDRTVYRIPTAAQIETMLRGAGFTRVTTVGDDAAAYPTHWFVADLPS